MTSNDQPKKKLNLNKETLLRLQERQLQSILGAEAMLSDTTPDPPIHSIAICCGVSVNGNCSDGAAAREENTCCKKSC